MFRRILRLPAPRHRVPMPHSPATPSLRPPSAKSASPSASAEISRSDGPDPSSASASSAGRSSSASSLSLGSAILTNQQAGEDLKLAHDLLRARRVRGSYQVSLGARLVCRLSLPFCLCVGLRFKADHGLALLILTMA